MKTAVVALLMLAAASGRYIRSSATFEGDDKQSLLAGFGTGPGKGVWKFKAKIQKSAATNPPPYYDFAIYSLRSDQPLPDFTCAQRHNTSSLHLLTFPLASSSVYSDTLTAELPEQVSAWGWRFYLVSCNQTATETVKVRYTLTLLGPGDTHLSVEDAGMDELQIYLCFFYFLVLCYAVYKFMVSLLSIDDVEGMLVILAFAVVLELLSFVFSIIHYSRAAEDGKGWILFRFFSQFMDVSAYLFILTTFVFVGSGYYVKTREFPSEMRYLPVLAFLGLSALWMVLDQFEESSALKRSDFRGIYGVFDILTKNAMLLWTFHIISLTSGSGPLILQQFMGKFKVVSALAFGSTGIALLLSLLVPGESRYKAFFLLSRVALGLAVVGFLRLISTEGQYHKIAGKADVLPSTKLHL